MGEVAVGEDRAVDLEIADQPLQLGLRIDVDALGIERAGELFGVAAAVDSGNLRRSEADDLEVGVVAKEDVEVVKVAPSGAQNQDSFAMHEASNGDYSKKNTSNFAHIRSTRAAYACA